MWSNIVNKLGSKYLSILRRAASFIEYGLIDLSKHMTWDDIYKRLFTELGIKHVIIIDVGAHHGESVDRFQQIFETPEIHCFEPGISNFKILKNNDRNLFEHKGNLVFNNWGLGSADGQQLYYETIKDKTNSFNRPNLKSSWVEKRAVENGFRVDEFITNEVLLTTKTLDDYLNSNSIKPNFLKIDTQAFNLNVLSGAKESLRKKVFDVIETEITPGNAYEKPEKFGEFIYFVEQFGYRLAGITHDHGISNKNINLSLSMNLFQRNELYLDLMFVREETLKRSVDWVETRGK